MSAEMIILAMIEDNREQEHFIYFILYIQNIAAAE